jgi:hypothetical protein
VVTVGLSCGANSLWRSILRVFLSAALGRFWHFAWGLRPVVELVLVEPLRHRWGVCGVLCRRAAIRNRSRYPNADRLVPEYVCQRDGIEHAISICQRVIGAARRRFFPRGWCSLRSKGRVGILAGWPQPTRDARPMRTRPESTRFTQAGAVYRLPNAARTLVANSYTELVTTGPHVAINVYADGSSSTFISDVWTGTLSNGTASGSHCGNWSTENGKGTTGLMTSVSAWTNSAGPAPEGHLICRT